MNRIAAYVRAGGVVVPVLTAVIAFIVAGLVVLITGHNPLSTYQAVFNGTGLNWVFPWVHGQERISAALNLQQTLIATTPLILVGLAVAFAFRAGLFNIGGQGQYLVGSYIAVWIGSAFAGCRPACTSCSPPGSAPWRAEPGRASPACSRRPSAPAR